jgi:hypothetical protein
LSLYALILDFILGLILLASFWTVPAVKKIILQIKGTRHLERYTKKARAFFTFWLSLLCLLIILVFTGKLAPAVYRTTHIALILNNLTQLINTIQFYAAFQLLRVAEFLMKLASGRKRINSYAIEESKSDPAPDASYSTPSAQDLFRLDESESAIFT